MMMMKQVACTERAVCAMPKLLRKSPSPNNTALKYNDLNVRKKL